MGDIERGNIDTMHRLQNPFFGSTKLLLSGQIKPHLSRNTENLQSFGFDCSNGGSKRVGMPPPHPPILPYSNISGTGLGSQNSSRGSLHSRSLSQPLFFLNDSLPPLSPSLYQKPTSPPNGGENMNLSSTKGNSLHITEGLPPRKVHRRSSSDVPFGFDSTMQSSPSSIPVGHTRGRGGFERTLSGGGNPVQLVKRELGSDKNIDCNVEGEVVDDLLSAYINMDSIDAMNSSGTDDNAGNENRDDMYSHTSGYKRNGCDSSDNEAESSVNESGSSRQRTLVASSGELKGSATSEVAPTTRHSRSVSMDSFMGNMCFGDESTKLLPSPSTGVGQLFLKDISNDANEFNLEFGHGEFTVAEMKKIMANEKLAEIAVADPKRVKRILANRQSAARSKERKTRYISELEHKVQTLQSEATTLSAQLTLIQRDSARLTSQNNELKFRLQAIDRQAQLQEALSEALTAEVQHLKIGTRELNQATMSKCFGQQLHINPQMFQHQQKQQQSIENNANQEHQKANDSNNESAMKNESTQVNQ